MPRGRPSNEYVRAVHLECADAYGALLTLPSALTAEWEKVLSELGVQQAKTVEVWPAGLAAAEWDAEACGEWLSWERPCFAIRPDYPIRTLLVSLKSAPGESPLELTSLPAGEPIFIQLPQLPVAVHKLTLTARPESEDKEHPPSELEVVMRIRDAHPLPSGLNPSGPLLVQIDPSAPTLEQFWEGQVEITVQGPLGRSITCCISLFEKDGAQATLRKILPPIQLPVSADSWQTHFEKYFRQADDVQQTFDNSRICLLDIHAAELGEFLLRCEREFKPLRWLVRHGGFVPVVRLIDDSGDNVSPTVSRITFDNPMSQTVLAFAEEYEVPSVGGLYVARKETYIAAVIAPPRTIRDFGDLSCEPRLPNSPRSPEAITKTLEIASLWTQAKLPGDFLSATRRQKVLLALAHRIAQLICGANWARAEIEARKGDHQFSYLKDAISRRPQDARLGKVLEEKCVDFAVVGTNKLVAGLASIAIEFRLLPPETHEDDVYWLSELALRLASDPGIAKVWAGIRLLEGIKQLMESATTLARAARFVVLAVVHSSGLEAVSTRLYESWRWD